MCEKLKIEDKIKFMVTGFLQCSHNFLQIFDLQYKLRISNVIL